MTTEPVTRPAREFPGGGYLAYIVVVETYYYQRLGNPDKRPPSINIFASRGGGVSWEFSVTDHTARLGQRALKVEIFDDAWAAFADLPELFVAMADGEIESLDELRTLLDRLGAVDQTPRIDPRLNQGDDAPVDLRDAARALKAAGMTPEQYAQHTDQPYGRKAR